MVSRPDLTRGQRDYLVRKAKAEAEGFSSPYERRVALGTERGLTPLEAAGRSSSGWERATRDPDGIRNVIATGFDRNEKNQQWKVIEYRFIYRDGRPEATVRFTGTSNKKEARLARIEELQALGVPYFADYLDADLSAPVTSIMAGIEE